MVIDSCLDLVGSLLGLQKDGWHCCYSSLWSTFRHWKSLQMDGGFAKSRRTEHLEPLWCPQWNTISRIGIGKHMCCPSTSFQFSQSSNQTFTDQRKL